LTYAGPLYGSSKRETNGKHKHAIRKVFHKQLKRLWEVAPHFRPENGLQFITTSDGYQPPATIVDLSKKFERAGYKFVPLVTEDLCLKCDLSVLYLRLDPPGMVIQSGDIDNRLKTLFDALKMPKDKAELGDGYVGPDDNEKPFFCLLEDDRLVTSVSVDTDILLEPLSSDKSESRLIITVRIIPIRLSVSNMHFV